MLHPLDSILEVDLLPDSGALSAEAFRVKLVNLISYQMLASSEDILPVFQADYKVLNLVSAQVALMADNNMARLSNITLFKDRQPEHTNSQLMVAMVDMDTNSQLLMEAMVVMATNSQLLMVVMVATAATVAMLNPPMEATVISSPSTEVITSLLLHMVPMEATAPNSNSIMDYNRPMIFMMVHKRQRSL
jgi:hypothetical protein